MKHLSDRVVCMLTCRSVSVIVRAGMKKKQGTGKILERKKKRDQEEITLMSKATGRKEKTMEENILIAVPLVVLNYNP